MSDRPGGQLAKRPLHFIWIADYSGSMSGKKIESLNFAIREAIPAMQEVADDNPNAEVLVRAVCFSAGAHWHVAQPTEVHSFKWNDLQADAQTDMGAALELVADELRTEKMPQRGLPPVLVLITDGQPSDDFEKGLKVLLEQPWGIKAVRIAVAIGEDADLDVLQKFIGNNEVKPLVASNVQDLVAKIKWASTVPLKAASNPASRTLGSPASGHVPIPAPPQDAMTIDASDVF